MQTIEANWEDEESNRQVAFSVQVVRKETAIEIHSMTPKQVTFLCPKSKSPQRSISVWTDKGRQLLTDQLRASGQLARFEQEIEATLAV